MTTDSFMRLGFTNTECPTTFPLCGPVSAAFVRPRQEADQIAIVDMVSRLFSIVLVFSAIPSTWALCQWQWEAVIHSLAYLKSVLTCDRPD